MEGVCWWERATQADIGGEKDTSPPLLSFCPPATLIEIRIYYSNLLNSACCQTDYFIFSPRDGNKNKSPWRALNKQNIFKVFFTWVWRMMPHYDNKYCIYHWEWSPLWKVTLLNSLATNTKSYSTLKLSIFYLLDFSVTSKSVAIIVCISSN